jgi:hypothetical protein
MLLKQAKRQRTGYIEPTVERQRVTLIAIDKDGSEHKLVSTYPANAVNTSHYMDIAMLILTPHTPTVRVIVDTYWTPTHPESVCRIDYDETVTWGGM